jgi:hypothetical protein
VLKVDADKDGIGGDDTADAPRYLVATKARTITQRKLRGLWPTVTGYCAWKDLHLQGCALVGCVPSRGARLASPSDGRLQSLNAAARRVV